MLATEPLILHMPWLRVVQLAIVAFALHHVWAGGGPGSKLESVSMEELREDLGHLVRLDFSFSTYERKDR